MADSVHSPAPAVVPPTPWRVRAGRLALPGAHVLGLWAFAIAQPLYDILQRNGEFFIAHRTTPFDLFAFTAIVSLGLPLLLVVPQEALAAAWPRAGRVALVGLIALLATALASQVLAHRVPMPTALHFAVAGVLGAALAWCYAARAGVRTFMTMLSPSAVVFPAIFLLHPSMSMFVRAATVQSDTAAVITGPAPPIVFLIFDQLPLASLMRADGGLDADRYPGFAALAGQATWYRNASTVAEFTGWAVPPIVSGQRPSHSRIPTSKSYPQNIFTWLGGRYRLEVQEPITQLCPEDLCDARREPIAVRLAGMTLDSSVVYLSAALPRDLRALLPPMTENWRDFVHDQRWQRRWVSESKTDRRQVPRDLIASISHDDPQPTLYFAHTLLPHEPYMYLRSGQAFTDDPGMVGLGQTGRWTTDDWTVTQAYQLHLLQVEYVDSIVGSVVDRLKAEGLYDAALVVVTSDHGASFRPGQHFKALEAANLADIMTVPLFIKAPHQQKGVIDDGNMQSVDVMPTIASLIDVPLTWTSEGHSGGRGPIDSTSKTIRYSGARIESTVDAIVVARGRDAAVARKVALFGEASGWRGAAASRPELIGKRVADLPTTEGPWHVLLDDADRFLSVDPSGPESPVLLTGKVLDARDDAVDAQLVIAVGGIVTAVSRTYRPDDALRGTWSAVADPALFTKGRSDVRVYVLSPDDALLHLAYSSRERPDTINLASRGAADYWAVKQSGLYPREGGPVPHRWTSGQGMLVVPMEPERRPRSLRVGITGIKPGGVPVTIALDDCVLFRGDVTEAPWYRTFSLGACSPALVSKPFVTIAITSPAWVAKGDSRTRGVAVETVKLLSQDWPIEPVKGQKARGAIHIVDALKIARQAGTSLPIVIANTGESTWISAAEVPQSARSVQIALRWRRAGATGAAVEQRLRLPHTLYPTDRDLIDTPLFPPEALGGTGPWSMAIVPIEQDGTPVPLETAVVVEVTSGRK